VKEAAVSRETVKRAVLKVHKSAAFTLLILGALAGCTVGRDSMRPNVETTETWRTPTSGTGSLGDLAWWRLFEDPALQQLIRTALEESKDLGLAVARVEEARARLCVTRASQFPQIDGR
jgi:multidrug efflux system outer membrane protein